MFGPFIYTCDRSIEVFEESKKYITDNNYADELADLAWACHSISDLIPQTAESLLSGHFFPWLESWDELQISFNLCLFGLYKQAMVSLRSGLELGLLSVYWNLNDDGHIVIREWLRSREDTPRHGDIWKKLEKHANFREFQQRFDIKSRLLKLGYLHDYVHTKGFKYSNSMGMLKSNFQTFEEHGFRTWISSFREVVEVLAILHLVKYPLGAIKYDYGAKFGIDKPLLGGLEVHEIDRLEKAVGSEVFQAIESLAENDENVQRMLEWLASLPDLTEEDIQQQIIDFDKSMIEQQGLEKWLEQEKRLMGDDYGKSERHRKKIDYLIEWAKENGFEKPAWEVFNVA